MNATGFQTLVGSCRQMNEVFRLIQRISGTDVTVLITGESGTGKELVARSIHNGSRANSPFIAINTGAITTELIATELFGHEKGAFTGALYRKEGKFELARDGTLFLDEISTMDEKTQISLLRVLEERQFQRVGGREYLNTNARILAATNEDLPKAIRTGAFREDLYHRLNIFQIHLPPLRNRGADIDLLSAHFLAKYSRQFGKELSEIEPRVRALFHSYRWPGNVRELQNIMLRSVIIAEGTVLTEAMLPSDFAGVFPDEEAVGLPIGCSLDEMQQLFIRKTLELANGNKSRAAKILNISRKAIYSKLSKPIASG